MVRITPVLAALIVLPQLAACAANQSPPPPMGSPVCNETKCKGEKLEALQAGKKTIASKLNAPSKAEFGRVFLARQEGRDIVCGEVTGVNGFGGYPPMRPFIVEGNTASIRPLENKRARGFSALANVLDTNRFDSVFMNKCGVPAS